jgi:hypothetical protein
MHSLRNLYFVRGARQRGIIAAEEFVPMAAVDYFE